MKRSEGPKISQEQISRIVEDAVRSVFDHNYHADKALEFTFKTNRLSDYGARRHIAESVYSILRNKMLYERLSQELFGNKSVTYRALYKVHQALLGAQRANANFPLTEAQDRILTLSKKLKKDPMLAYSMPAWLLKHIKEELGDRADAVLTTLQNAPTQYLRVNTLKTTVPQLLQAIDNKELGVEMNSLSPTALKISTWTDVFRWPEYKEGHFEIQDAASQAVVDTLELKPGLRVVDACAGAGGKTLAMAALMNNRGKIIALDVAAAKIAELKKRAAKADVQCVEARVIEDTKSYKRLYNTADRLLLDVPCTGLGVLRRNPDIRWRIAPEDITRLIGIQQEILNSYSPIVKTGGLMAYSTCSILPSEGEEQVKKFMEASAGKWTLVSERRFWPEEHDCDGFYVAVLKKNADNEAPAA